MPRILTERTLSLGVRALCERDRDLARIVKAYGRPPMWERTPGFPTLLHIILEQQVSLASARSAFEKLQMIASPLTPMRFLELDDATLKAAGFSRQKTIYGRILSESIVSGELDLDRIVLMADEEARAELMRIKGIGLWTADIYLLMALQRPDIWPRGDLALASAVQKVKKLGSVPDHDRLGRMSERWRPWRAVAARLFWHYYLSSRKSNPTKKKR
ncbi:MAG: DNA-3-methyladenine glycosylase 2 family protein [Blastocatellia bacterium AA13]|nr:MAG: DNA-3-methyladenine glycosylase 2 family protein [Blastocatellia bacterium AA13]